MIQGRRETIATAVLTAAVAALVVALALLPTGQYWLLGGFPWLFSALVVAGFALVLRPGRSRAIAGGMLAGCAALVLLVVTHFE